MFKLMVVGGPNRGATYSVNEGETSIGRQSGNNVVLTSGRVSKRHCVLVASNGELVVKDAGSSNGTFVNGVLTKEKSVKNGDRISVGEFVFEVVEHKKPQRPSRPRQNFPIASPGGGNVIAFPGVGLPAAAPMPDGVGAGIPSSEPKTTKEKAMYAFDHFVMPFFYGMSMKNEWRLVLIGVFAVFCVVNMFVSISPLLEASRENIVRESERRAQFMARQIADAAAPLVAARAESRVEIGAAENADGVKLAVVIDMENRIIAPGARQNSYMTGGGEAVWAVKARDYFRAGKESGFVKEIDVSTVIAVEPLKAYNQATAKNTVIGMAIVSIDTTLATMGMGDVGLVYSETLIITAVLGALALLILYRLTLKPLQVLGDDMDKALKGDISQVTHEFKWEELNPLWDLVNSALQRIPKSTGAFGGTGQMEPPITAEDFAGPLRAMGGFVKMGVAVCDRERKIVSLNSVFEEITGIRSEASVGQDMISAARDQAFAALAQDLFDRVQPGTEGVGEDFDFSGVSHKVQALAFGGMGGVRCYVLLAYKAGTDGGYG